jgi:hypothetical protein
MSNTMTQLKAKVHDLARQMERNLRQWQQSAERWLKAKMSKRGRAN